jgi:hypothetical protein
MITIKITWKYCLAFYCLIMLYSSLHELVHHFVGYAVCGAWGYKTFNYFKTACEGSPVTLLATYAGPVFSFAMMWVGAYLLKSKNASAYTKQLAFALIFAQMPLQRMLMCFFKMNDEYYATAQLFGHTTWVYWLVIISIWLCCVPPLIVAYKAIGNKYKIAWFLFYAFLFPYLLWGPVFALLEYLLVSKHVMDGTIIGIAYLFILNEVVTIAGYMLTKKYFDTTKVHMKTN